MQKSTPNTGQSAISGFNKPTEQGEKVTRLPWTLQRLNRTWFLTEQGQAVRFEHPLEDGATDEQWRALIVRIGVAVRNDNKPWGPQGRRDFLNWLETEYPDRMPQFFDSKGAALAWFEESKKPGLNEENQPDSAV